MTTIFGTDGIRSAMGTEFLQQEKLPLLGQAIALWAHQKYGANPHILLAHDTRISCAYIKAALKSGLLLYNITLYDAGVLPTPAALHIIQSTPELHAAIIISASHNPYYDNGIKLIDKTTGKLSQVDEHTLSALLTEKTTRYFTYDTFGADHHFSHAIQLYQEKLISFFKPNFLHGITIVLDTAHGATYACAPAIFKALGAHVITINNTPTGININDNCGALHLESLQAAVIKNNAHIGFAFDGDGDRIMAVNKHGIIKDGDDILALLSTHPQYKDTHTIIGTIMTNCGFEAFLKRHQKQLIRTQVGDKYIAEQLRTQNLLVGGEPSGHIIVKDIINTGDAILVALKIVETIIHTNNWDLHTFEKYPQVMINVPVVVRKDLSSAPLLEIIEDAQATLDSGRLIVRFSGTELLLRVMVEASTHDKAYSIAHTVAETLEKKLKELV